MSQVKITTRTPIRKIQELIPNALTVSRFALSFVVLFLLQKNDSVVALVVFILAAFTDFPDGYLARKWNVVSNFGERYDPFVDKFLLLLPLGFFTALYQLTWFFFGLILVREIVITAVREYRYSTGHSMPADRHGKIKVNLQYTLVILCFLIFLKVLMLPTVVVLVWYEVVSIYTAWSGILYLYNLAKKPTASPKKLS